MGAINLVKLLELYKELLSSYITKDGVLIATAEMEDKDILDILVIKNYIIKVIGIIEDEYIDKGTLHIIGGKVTELIRKIQAVEDFTKHPCLFKMNYSL